MARNRNRPARPRHGFANACPAMDCAGGGPDRQHSLSAGQLARVSDAAREAIAAEGGAQRCGYCGCVYIGSSRRTLGFLDNGARGDGWLGR